MKSDSKELLSSHPGKLDYGMAAGLLLALVCFRDCPKEYQFFTLLFLCIFVLFFIFLFFIKGIACLRINSKLDQALEKPISNQKSDQPVVQREEHLQRVA